MGMVLWAIKNYKLVLLFFTIVGFAGLLGVQTLRIKNLQEKNQVLAQVAEQYKANTEELTRREAARMRVEVIAAAEAVRRDETRREIIDGVVNAEATEDGPVASVLRNTINKLYRDSPSP